MASGGVPTVNGVQDSHSYRHGIRPFRIRGNEMLGYALAFFVVAIIAALFGFTGIAVGAAGIAKILFMIFLVIAGVAFIVGLSRRA
jgi:uncharacterized membrane protein YtjA (UPF0391 family)